MIQQEWGQGEAVAPSTSEMGPKLGWDLASWDGGQVLAAALPPSKVRPGLAASPPFLSCQEVTRDQALPGNSVISSHPSLPWERVSQDPSGDSHSYPQTMICGFTPTCVRCLTARAADPPEEQPDPTSLSGVIAFPPFYSRPSAELQGRG